MSKTLNVDIINMSPCTVPRVLAPDKWSCPGPLASLFFTMPSSSGSTPRFFLCSLFHYREDPGWRPGTHHFRSKWGYEYPLKLHRNTTTRQLQGPWEEGLSRWRPGVLNFLSFMNEHLTFPSWISSTLYFTPLSPHSRTNPTSLCLHLSCPLQYSQPSAPSGVVRS